MPHFWIWFHNPPFRLGTKKGKFMTEDEAKNAGYKAAKELGAKKAKKAKTAKK